MYSAPQLHQVIIRIAEFRASFRGCMAHYSVLPGDCDMVGAHGILTTLGWVERWVVLRERQYIDCVLNGHSQAPLTDLEHTFHRYSSQNSNQRFYHRLRRSRHMLLTRGFVDATRFWKQRLWIWYCELLWNMSILFTDLTSTARIHVQTRIIDGTTETAARP